MATQSWQFDPVHSSIQFAARHLVVSKVRGAFRKWSGAFEWDPADPATAKLEVRIDIASVDTHEPQRDAHLRTSDFFDASTYPEMIFTSKRVESMGDGELKVTGDLTLRGVTREVVLKVEPTGVVKDPWGNDRAGFTATATIDRKLWGVNYNQLLEAGGFAISDKIEILIEVEVFKAAEVKAAA